MGSPGGALDPSKLFVLIIFDPFFGCCYKRVLQSLFFGIIGILLLGECLIGFLVMLICVSLYLCVCWIVGFVFVFEILDLWAQYLWMFVHQFCLICLMLDGKVIQIDESANCSIFWHAMITPLSVWAYLFQQMSHLSRSGPTFF